MFTILIVEDDVTQRLLLRDALIKESCIVIEAATGEGVLETVVQERPDLVVLDIELPCKNGFEICEELRHAGLRQPVLFLSRRAGESSKVRGLAGGADDYLTKPFSIAEFQARVAALLRRAHNFNTESKRVRSGDILIDLESKQVLKGGGEVRLTAKEFKLLALLAANRGRTLHRGHIMREVWGTQGNHDTRVLDVTLASIRKKLGEKAAAPKHIRAVPAEGYYFV